MSTEWGPGHGEETSKLPHSRAPQYRAGPPRPSGEPPYAPQTPFPPPDPPPWQGPPPAGPIWHQSPGQPPYPYPVGAGGLPPGGQPARPRRKRWPWWVAGAAAVAVVVLVATLVVRGSSNSKTALISPSPTSTRIPVLSKPAPTSSPPAPPPLDVAALPTFLASAQQVSTLLNGVQLNALEVAASLGSDVSISPAKCASAVAPALTSTYTGSGNTGVAVQGLREASPGRHKVIQSVVVFPDDAAAQRFYAQQVAAWQDCRMTDVTVSFANGQPDQDAKITIVLDSEGIASTVLLPAGVTDHPDSQCDRAMGRQRNVIVDVRVCGQNTITVGVRLVRAINEKISRRS